MNVFQAVKQSIETRQAAEAYGIEVSHNGMCCCPFHNDSNPSMKVDSRYHCFGCGEDGDVIDFVGKLYSLTPIEAARKLAADFCISYDSRQNEKSEKPSISVYLKRQQERKEEDRCYRVLCYYYRTLKEWKECYAPKSQNEKLNPLFVEAITNIDRIDYLLDVFLSGTKDERAELVKDEGKEVNALERRFSKSRSRTEQFIG